MQRSTGLLIGAAALLSAAVPGSARAEAPDARTEALSIGSPTRGSIRGAVALEGSRVLKLRWPDRARWALPDLVSMLQRAARRVEREHPGSVLLVGTLSRREGGEVPGHASHQSGRDADIGFYYLDSKGRSVRTARLMRVTPERRVAGQPELRFDVTRNWDLVAAMLTDPEVIVQHIFVANFLRETLLDEAKRRRVSRSVLARATRALLQPSSGPPHDDHFHVRIACPSGQTAVCVSTPGMDRVANDGAEQERSRKGS